LRSDFARIPALLAEEAPSPEPAPAMAAVAPAEPSQLDLLG
jgi:hypothetical protein